jgi:uncharacterized membrane protein
VARKLEKIEMNSRTLLVVSFLAIGAMLGISLWGWVALPEGARIATHWDASGNPNGYSSKALGLIALPGVALALTLLFAVLPYIEPRRANLLASRKLYLSGWYGGLFVMANAQLLIVLHATGQAVDARRWTTAALGLLYIFLGNFMGKSRSNFFVGVRLPWTLSSERAWSKSNRLAGFGFVATGFATLIAVFAAKSLAPAMVLGVGTALSITVAGVASYFYWKHDDNKIHGGSIHE